MEDNNQKKGKKNIIDTSVVLSFVVAIFAVFSLIMAGASTMQKSGISYAAPNALPDEFAFKYLNGGVVGGEAAGDFVIGSVPGTSKMFAVNLYTANNDPSSPVFCVEHNNQNIDDGVLYSSDGAINDYGLLYILNNSFANGIRLTTVENNSTYVESWITQTAVWLYLYEKEGGASVPASSKNYLTADEVSAIKSATKLTAYDKNNSEIAVVYDGENLYEKYIKGLVEKAKTASDLVTVKVTKANNELSQTVDKKFYESAMITVTGDPSSALERYKVTLSGIDGAFAVDEDGQKLSDVVNANTRFYVRIPAEKITEEVQKVIVTVDGTFKTLEGNYYIAGDHQKVVTVKASSKVVSGGTEVEFVGTADTGMSSIQTIYFIGLIILLCGVGIVYANAKPVQVKQ